MVKKSTQRKALREAEKKLVKTGKENWLRHRENDLNRGRTRVEGISAMQANVQKETSALED